MNQTSSYHFIGLGGIGMSALARLLLQKGERVQGSDTSKSALLERLEKEGAALDGELNEKMTVVYSSAIAPDHPERLLAASLQTPLLHRSELLDQLMRGKKPLLVTGTHGKTTTTALLAWVLLQAGLDPSFVIGGIAKPLFTNGKWGQGDYFVAEADESDGSFLKTAAFGGIVTNLDNDHLDYWKTIEALREGFARFFSQALQPHTLFWCADDPGLRALSPPGESYGFSEKADWRIAHFQTREGLISYHLEHRGTVYPFIEAALLGRHNALNSAAVFALAIRLGIDEKAIRKALQSYGGVSRRMEWKGRVGQIEVYDDYGHHPTEIAATIQGLREQIGSRRLVVLFQPHRFTRVRDLLEQFSQCFDLADRVVLTDIYSAGEAPIPEVTTEALAIRMEEKLKGRFLCIPRDKLEAETAKQLEPGDVVLTIGAGDITHSGPQLLNFLSLRGAS